MRLACGRSSSATVAGRCSWSYDHAGLDRAAVGGVLIGTRPDGVPSSPAACSATPTTSPPPRPWPRPRSRSGTWRRWPRPGRSRSRASRRRRGRSGWTRTRSGAGRAGASPGGVVVETRQAPAHPMRPRPSSSGPHRPGSADLGSRQRDRRGDRGTAGEGLPRHREPQSCRRRAVPSFAAGSPRSSLPSTEQELGPARRRSSCVRTLVRTTRCVGGYRDASGSCSEGGRPRRRTRPTTGAPPAGGGPMPSSPVRAAVSPASAPSLAEAFLGATRPLADRRSDHPWVPAEDLVGSYRAAYWCALVGIRGVASASHSEICEVASPCL